MEPLALREVLERGKLELRELEPIRNDIAHSREISAQAGKKLEIYAREVIAATEK